MKKALGACQLIALVAVIPFILAACAPVARAPEVAKVPAVDITDWACSGNWVNPKRGTTGTAMLKDFKIAPGGKLTGYAEFTNSPVPPDPFYGTIEGNAVKIDGPHGWMRLTVAGHHMIGEGADNTNRVTVNFDLACKDTRTAAQQ